MDLDLLEQANKVTESVKAERVSRDVRRFLAESMGFLNGLKTASGYADFTLDRALALHLEELSGSPANGRPNRIQRLEALLTRSATAVAAATLLDADDLGSELVSTGSFTQLGGLLPGASALGVTLPDSLPDNSVVDAVSGSGVENAQKLYSGDKMALAKDVLA